MNTLKERKLNSWFPAAVITTTVKFSEDSRHDNRLQKIHITNSFRFLKTIISQNSFMMGIHPSPLPKKHKKARILPILMRKHNYEMAISYAEEN